MKLELADPILWQSVQTQIDSDFGEGVTRSILANRVPAVIAREGSQSIYLIPYDWMTLADENLDDFEMHHIGLWLGDMVDERFRLGLPILEHLSTLTENIIIVNRLSAESFTYGKSIIKEGVVRLNTTLKRRQRVVVIDQDGQVIGLAALSIDGERLVRLSKEKLVAKNLVDIGWYLRRMG